MEETEDINTEIEVSTPSGAVMQVISPEEVIYYESTADKYKQEYAFTNISDLKELDRIILLELLCHRYGVWISTEHDYDGNSVDTTELTKRIKDNSLEIRQVKKALGIDKSSRDKDKGSSVVEYISTLLRRGGQFGIHRNEQAVMAIILINEIIGRVQLYRNADDVERKELHTSPEELLDWIWNEVKPQFEAVDAKFRKEQRYWIQDL